MEVMFHIGLAKAGSTYLQRWYAQHPDIVQFQDLFPIIKKGQWQLENDPKLTVLSAEDLSYSTGTSQANCSEPAT